MIRFTLSRFWPQAALAAGLLVVIAAVLVVTGLHLHHLWGTVLAPCLAAHPDIARDGPGPNYRPGYPGACQTAFLTLAPTTPRTSGCGMPPRSRCWRSRAWPGCSGGRR